MTRTSELARKHLHFGWWGLLAFLSLGLVLEAFHGLKIGYYLGVENEARRLAFRLGHAHGTLLSLVNVVFALTLASRFSIAERAAERASSLFLAATVLLPGGFLLGGLFVHGGDPSVGVFLVPFGALALFLAVLFVAREVARGVRIREMAHGSAEYEVGVALRQRVLRNPLGLELPPEARAEEVKHRHLGAFEGERLVACLLLEDHGEGTIKMRQVAVDFDRQGRGIGKALVLRSEELARELGFVTMLLHARETAVSFYTELGYEVFGERFVEVTVPHRKMQKRLAAEKP